MNDYKIRISHKINTFKEWDDIKVFIDGVEIKSKKFTFSHMVSEGKHILRIEQFKIYKCKYSYALIPFYLLDLSFLDTTPLYAVYETELYIDKDIDINVILDRKILKPKRFIRVMNFHFNVVFNNEVKANLIKNDFTASYKERRIWFSLSTIFITLPIALLICLFGVLIFYSIKQSKPIFALVFSIAGLITLILVLIFLLSNCYANYKNIDNY